MGRTTQKIGTASSKWNFKITFLVICLSIAVCGATFAQGARNEVVVETDLPSKTDTISPSKEQSTSEIEAQIKSYLYGGNLELDYLKPKQLSAVEQLLTRQLENEDDEEVRRNLLNESNERFLKKVLTQLFPPPPSTTATYGHRLFERDSLTILFPNSITKVNDAYILGSGDEITISIFGASQYDAAFEVKSDGYIRPSGMPKIYLKGINWGKAKQLLQNRYKVFYLFRPEQFAASLSKPRTVLVNVLGEVKEPSSFNLVATNTALNALLAAGGPTQKGSVRKIRLIRGTSVKEIDVYTLMNNPSAQFELSLEDNDIIQVPLANKIVEVKGASKRPLKYELKESETLSDLLALSGGFSSDAYQKLIQISRFTDAEKLLIDVDWTKRQNRDFELQNGDVITIKSIGDEVTNSVTVEGAVELPGEYALQSTRRISDLLQKARIKPEAKLDIAFLVRTNPDSTSKLVQLDLGEILENIGSDKDLLLKPKDRLITYLQNRYITQGLITVGGAVREGMTEIPFDPDSSVTVQRAILLAGGLLPEATDFGYILRTHPDRSKEYIRINIAKALEDAVSKANLRLQPNDFLYTLRQSRYTDSLLVSIKGAVRSPLSLQYSSSLSVKDLFTIAGGFKREAALDRIEVSRLVAKGQEVTRTIVIKLAMDESFNIISGPKDFTLQPYDEIVVRSLAEYEEPAIVTIEGEVAFPGEYAIIKQNETLIDLIARAGGITEEAFPEGAYLNRESVGKVGLNLTSVGIKATSREDVLLKGADVIVIPKREDIVSIYTQHTKAAALPSAEDNTVLRFTYTSGKSVKWYLQEYAGGLTDKAFKDEITVEYANGAVKGVEKRLLFRKYPKPKPGSTIRISNISEPMKQEKEQSAEPAKKRKGAVSRIILTEEAEDDSDNTNRN
ncbi:MAG: SLBB domain-containing protein [Bacteroidota bacterium]